VHIDCKEKKTNAMGVQRSERVVGRKSNMNKNRKENGEAALRRLVKRGYSESQVCAIMGVMIKSDEDNHHPDQTIEELYAVVVGDVQGAGFRYFVVEQAQSLALHGYVRNDSSGDVEVVAQGTRSALEHLLVVLRRGPEAAQVHEVQTTWRAPTEHVSGFHVRW